MQQIPYKSWLKTSCRLWDIQQVMPGNENNTKPKNYFVWKPGEYQQAQYKHTDTDSPDNLERNEIEIGIKGPGKGDNGPFSNNEPQPPFQQENTQLFFSFPETLQVNGSAR